MSQKKYFRKRVYRWHRVISLIVALPILLWSLSGFLHPVMSSFKPKVRNQSLPVAAIDTSRIQVSLQQAMEKNKIALVHNFRIIKLDSSFYYQIQHSDKDSLTYLSCSDGKQLKDGDKLYAAYLAQRYLSEPVKEKQNASHGHQLAADIGLVAMNFVSQKSYVKSRVKSVDLVTEFNGEYKNSNVLLPVYKVGFERGDNIRLYIETSTDRLATAVDEKRAWFVKFFAIAHSWSFLDGMGSTKQIILAMFSFLCFISSVLGFYVYNITGKKKASSPGKFWHRTLGNVFVVTTALYGISGAWHAVQKLSEKEPAVQTALIQNEFSKEELTLAPAQLLGNLHHTGAVSGISIVRMYDENYWQLTVSDGKHKYKKYIHTKTGKELMHGDVAYARYLACTYSGNTLDAITGSAALTKFTDSYSMKYKRLPVMEIRFRESGNYYIETNTGKLSAITDSYDKAERFSFSNLHMHHYWEHWFGEKGKSIQKTVLITSTLGLLLLAMTGVFIYLSRRAKR